MYEAIMCHEYNTIHSTNTEATNHSTKCRSPCLIGLADEFELLGGFGHVEDLLQINGVFRSFLMEGVEKSAKAVKVQDNSK